MTARARAEPGRFARPLAATSALLLARFFPLAPLEDAATGLPLAGARLELSWAHLLLTPFSAWAERMTCAGLLQHAAFAGTALVLFALRGRRRPREWGLFAAGLLTRVIYPSALFLAGPSLTLTALLLIRNGLLWLAFALAARQTWASFRACSGGRT